MKRLYVIQLILILCSSFCYAETLSYTSGATYTAPLNPIAGLNVDPSVGSFSYSVPIIVPPGRNGIQPDLAFAYNSYADLGILGKGWDIAIPYIERSTKRGIPRYDNTDTFILINNGSNELVSIGDGEYRARIESAFLRIRYLPDDSWEVTDKSGTKYLFGTDADTRLPGLNGTYRWHLKSVIDVYGNYMDFAYIKSYIEVDGIRKYMRYYIDRIDYTGGSGLNPRFSVRFNYDLEPSSRWRSSYRSGERKHIARRLREVRVYMDYTLIRKYTLTYRNDNESRVSLLSSIEQYGLDGIVRSWTISFEYQTIGQHWNEPSWSELVGLRLPDGNFVANGRDDGRRLVDIDSDGIPELMIAKDGYKRTMRLDGRFIGEWEGEPIFLPSDFVTNGQDQGVRFADLDGDGFLDMSIARNGYKGTYLNRRLVSPVTWQRQNDSWNIPDGEFVIDGEDQGRRLADLDGDGCADLIIGKDGYKAVYINKKGSWEQHNDWNIPDGDFVTNGEDQGRRLADLNGDGLIDLIIGKDGYKAAYINNSRGWEQNNSYNLPCPAFIVNSRDNGVRMADLNYDGLTDIIYARQNEAVEAYINTGTGYNRAPEWETLPEGIYFVNADNEDEGIAIEDIDYDGFPDIMKAKDNDKRTYRFSASRSNLLNRIILPYGGEIGIDYAFLWEGSLTSPFPMYTAARVTINDGLGNISRTTYEYSGGYYNYDEREFMGFSNVLIIDPEWNERRLYFFLYPYAYKGKLYQEDYYDRGIAKSITYTWADREVYPGVKFVYLNNKKITEKPRGSTGQAVVQEYYTYDDYGNITIVSEGFHVESSNGARPGHRLDYWYEQYTVYTYNQEKWIMDKPAYTYLIDRDPMDPNSWEHISTRVFLYDNNQNVDDPPAYGNITYKEEGVWRGEPWHITRYTYDQYGNLASITDPRGNRTTTTYDELFIYPITVTDPLGYETSTTYDPKIGQVLTTTTPNNRTTSYQYDVHGRLVTAANPKDTIANPTQRYSYLLDERPVRIVLSTYEDLSGGGSRTHTETTYLDGLGRTIGAKKRLDDGTYIITTAVKYNNRGLVEKEWLSYNTGADPGYTEPDVGLPYTTYEYDWAGRVIRGINPDNTFFTKAYSISPFEGNDSNLNDNGEIITITDEEGNDTTYISDGRGRITQIQEGDIVTRYNYEPHDRLISVIDNMGNTTQITYDPLGRKRRMTDPDMGRWEYNYDLNGNLTSQTNARGEVTRYEYDALNRITLKDYSAGEDIIYRYDEDREGYPVGSFKGLLTSVTDPNGLTNYYYDENDNIIGIEEQIDGQTYTTETNYNNLDWVTGVRYPDGEMVNYTYNPMGIETVTGNFNYITNIDYNPMGKITQMNYGNNTVMNYTYDPITTRLTNITGPGMDLGYLYDNVGNITQINNQTKNTQQVFTYDNLYRLTQAQGPYGTLTYNYNTIGNMTFNSEVGNYIYGQNNAGPHAVTIAGNRQYTYDANGNMLSNGRFTFQYDLDDRLISTTLVDPTEQRNINLNPGWNFFTLPLDPANNNTPDVFNGINYEQIDKFNSQQQRYDHNVNIPEYNQFNSIDYGLGYLVYIPGNSPETLNLSGTPSSEQAQIQLSAGWNLIGTAYTEAQSIGYVFSSLVFGEDYDVIAEYDEAVQSYKYYRNNPAGDTLSTVEPNGVYFVHCLRDTALILPPVTEISNTTFIYDYEGNRIKKTDSSGATIYIGDLYQINPDGSTAKYIYAGDQRVAEVHTQGNEVHTYYYHSDHLGSSTVITDENGNVVQELEYKPYGQLITNLRNSGHDVSNKFTDQELDDSTGLYYYGARYYDPVLCRFTQADTLVPEPFNPQSLNRYSYTLNNPVNYIDPSGFYYIDPKTKIIYESKHQKEEHGLLEIDAVEINGHLVAIAGDPIYGWVQYEYGRGWDSVGADYSWFYAPGVREAIANELYPPPAPPPAPQPQPEPVPVAPQPDPVVIQPEPIPVVVPKQSISSGIMIWHLQPRPVLIPGLGGAVGIGFTASMTGYYAKGEGGGDRGDGGDGLWSRFKNWLKDLPKWRIRFRGPERHIGGKHKNLHRQINIWKKGVKGSGRRFPPG